MIELFSRVPDALSVVGESHLTPIPIDDEISNLSAILLDDEYYAWIQTGKSLVENIYVAEAECLIPLKAKAWLDLSARRKKDGGNVGSKQIKKHLNDVFRLSQLLAPNQTVRLPDLIRKDMAEFLSEAQKTDVQVRSLGIRYRTKDEIIGDLRRIYQVGN